MTTHIPVGLKAASGNVPFAKENKNEIKAKLAKAEKQSAEVKETVRQKAERILARAKEREAKMLANAEEQAKRIEESIIAKTEANVDVEAQKLRLEEIQKAATAAAKEKKHARNLKQLAKREENAKKREEGKIKAQKALLNQSIPGVKERKESKETAPVLNLPKRKPIKGKNLKKITLINKTNDPVEIEKRVSRIIDRQVARDNAKDERMLRKIERQKQQMEAARRLNARHSAEYKASNRYKRGVMFREKVAKHKAEMDLLYKDSPVVYTLVERHINSEGLVYDFTTTAIKNYADAKRLARVNHMLTLGKKNKIKNNYFGTFLFSAIAENEPLELYWINPTYSFAGLVMEYEIGMAKKDMLEKAVKIERTDLIVTAKREKQKQPHIRSRANVNKRYKTSPELAIYLNRISKKKVDKINKQAETPKERYERRINSKYPNARIKRYYRSLPKAEVKEMTTPVKEAA